MRTEIEALLDHVSEMGQELSPDSIDRLAGQVGSLADGSWAKRLSAPNARERTLLARLAELWSGAPEVDPRAVSLALRSAQRTAQEVGSRQTIELVWTGPRTDEVPVRRSDQALREVIDSAESELLLISYAVYNPPEVAKRLTAALERGVDVRLVLEFSGATEGDQTYDPFAALGELPDQVRVYHWPFAERPELAGTDRRGYIHVKCAVADANLAFVSSANLTAYAMEANMELGVLVRGGIVPKRIAAHFRRLIRQGTLKPYEPEG